MGRNFVTLISREKREREIMSDSIRICSEVIFSSEAILITAGAGMGADSGLHVYREGNLQEDLLIGRDKKSLKRCLFFRTLQKVLKKKRQYETLQIAV